MKTQIFIDGELMTECNDYHNAIFLICEYEKSVQEIGAYLTKSVQYDENSGYGYTEFLVNWRDVKPSIIVIMVDGYYL